MFQNGSFSPPLAGSRRQFFSPYLLWKWGQAPGGKSHNTVTHPIAPRLDPLGILPLRVATLSLQHFVNYISGVPTLELIHLVVPARESLLW